MIYSRGGHTPLWMMLIGTLVSAIVGYLAIKLLKFVRWTLNHLFYYTWAVGLLVLFYSRNSRLVSEFDHNERSIRRSERGLSENLENIRTRLLACARVNRNPKEVKLSVTKSVDEEMLIN